MSESSAELKKVVEYMKAHWPSEVKPGWQVGLEEYPAIAERVFADFTAGASQSRQFIRIAGLSGSGKTTQILPAVEGYCKKKALQPVLVAARRFVEYHPHCQEISDFYGAENLRKKTDEFSTIMMFMTLAALIHAGYDIVLDVTLLDPSMEEILMRMLSAAEYSCMLLMIATSPTVTAHFLGSRSWRHTPETEAEFIRATTHALDFYATHFGGMRIILWSVYDLEPIYDGPISGALEIFSDYSARTELPKDDDAARAEAKLQYLVNL